MATNNNGNLLDSSGNVAVDYVWGNFPLQPNDQRVAGGNVVTFGGGAYDNAWSSNYTYASDLLVTGNISKTLHYGVVSLVPADSHEIVLADYAGYPGNIPGGAKYFVTEASADGTTVTYLAQNNLKVGDTVTVAGLGTGAFNLVGATVAFANAVKFTVTNAATGATTRGYGATATVTTGAAAADGAYVSGVFYIAVPNVLGLTTANASDSLVDAGMGTVTTASAATNAAKTVTAAARTAGSATITITASSHAYVAGNSVTISSTDATVNGTYSVVSATTHTFTVVGTATTVLALTGLSGSVAAVAGTIKTQSVAAGAATIAKGTAVTITPWAAAS